MNGHLENTDITTLSSLREFASKLSERRRKQQTLKNHFGMPNEPFKV